jgi:hypothetical protein
MESHEQEAANLLEYFRALRTEIIEAQKLRVQVGLAKTVFLGTLLVFFFKDAKGDLTILICPFVALMFDCMVYGLSFNIRDVGSYIGEHIETQMALKEPWQRHRAKRVTGGFRDWGRIAFRVGSYGLSAAVTVTAFVEARPPVGTLLSSGAGIWRIALMVVLAVAWAALICAEFYSKKSAAERLAKSEETHRAAKAKHASS